MVHEKNGLLFLSSLGPKSLENFAGQDLFRFDGRVRIVEYRSQLISYVYMNDPKKGIITQTHRKGFAIPVVAEIYAGHLAHERVLKVHEQDFNQVEALLKDKRGQFKFGLAYQNIPLGKKVKFFLKLNAPLYVKDKIRELGEDELHCYLQRPSV